MESATLPRRPLDNSPYLMDIYLNGHMKPAHEATVSVEDAGLQHAVGLFETMRAYHGKVFRLNQHLARLRQSAMELGLSAEMNTEPLADAVNLTLSHNKLTEARLRLTITAGTLSMLKKDGEDTAVVRQTVAVVPSEPTAFAPEYFEQGVRVAIHAQGANPFDITAGHKTLNYWARLRALRQAAALGCSESVWLNVTNHLASGCVSNLFLVKDGILLTPIARGEEKDEALPAPVLPGITRAAVIEAAQKNSIEVVRRMLSVNDLLNADEVFLTNSNWQVLPVTAVEKTDIADAKPGPMTGSLRQAVLGMIEAETINS